MLAIHFPKGERDILVELFTPDNDTTVMVLCAVAITHVGMNLDVDPTVVVPVMDSKDGSINVSQFYFYNEPLSCLLSQGGIRGWESSFSSL